MNRLLLFLFLLSSTCSFAQTVLEGNSKKDSIMLEIKKIKIQNLTFDCRVAGKEEDELVILLHGFPESAYMWVDLMEDISALGYYCVAPDLRGYSKEACPKGKKNYGLGKLKADVMNIAKSLGREKFHLIGHDWGAAIGWQVVHDHPDAILSWTGLSVPHLQAFFEAIATDKDQKNKSRYMYAFQIPLLPEINIRKNDFKVFRKLWKNSSQTEVEDYLSIFRKKRSLTAALNYYRGNIKLVKAAAKEQIMGDISAPTLFIWGENDVAIGSVSVEKGHDFMKGYYKFLKLEAGHFLIQTNYLEIKTAVTEHLLKFGKEGS
jgi:pimeloyl-ACP methyl ester carboxylesterase